MYALRRIGRAACPAGANQGQFSVSIPIRAGARQQGGRWPATVSDFLSLLAHIGCGCVQWPTIKGVRPPGGWGGAIERAGGLGGQELASKWTRRRAGVS